VYISLGNLLSENAVGEYLDSLGSNRSDVKTLRLREQI